jgi:signal transduction histidine kinase
MPAEDRARAFDRFWRGPGAPSDSGGFGLGLAIVRQLVAADGGTIELRSPPPGGLEAVISLRAGVGPAVSTSPATEVSGPAGPY